MLAMAPLTIAIVAQLAAAWSSARPPECQSLEAPRSANVWERAKDPELRPYCERLASAASKLAAPEGMPDEALALADAADKARPGHAAPRMVAGRALERLGRHDAALAAFREGVARDGRALDDPHALFAYARALAATGEAEAARGAYRALLPRTTQLSWADRVEAELEAGLLALAAGPAALDEATSIFREALLSAQDAAHAIAAFGLALALDRSGAVEEARAVVRERTQGDPRPLFRGARVRDLLKRAPKGEVDALLAIALELRDVPGAREAWRRAAEHMGSSSVWYEHARARASGAPHAGKAPARGETRAGRVDERPRGAVRAASSGEGGR
jgi:tetratricopeptide (TPR) repeat protein